MHSLKYIQNINNNNKNSILYNGVVKMAQNEHLHFLSQVNQNYDYLQRNYQ